MEITKEFIDQRPLSYSSLKAFKKSPVHYIHYISTQKTATPAMELGSLIDCLLLTKDEFENKYFVIPKLDMRKTIDKEKMAQLMAAEEKFKLENNKSRRAVDEIEYEKASLIVKTVECDENASEILKCITQTQYKLSYIDEETQLPYVGFIDGLGEKDNKPIIGELKTCQSASEKDFGRDAFNLDYPIQAAGYCEGLKRKRGIFPDFYYIAVETVAPYGVNVIKAPSDYLDYGKEQLRGLFDDFKFCMDNNFFDKSYSFKSLSGYNHLTVPGYIKFQS